MATDSEIEIVEQYSSPGLKRGMLSRYGKRWHLRENYRMTQSERDKLLDELYRPENNAK